MHVEPSKADEFNIFNEHIQTKKEGSRKFKHKIELKKMQEDLLKKISLKLWLINLLLEESVEEEQFRKMFDDYKMEYENLLSMYNKMILHARNLTPLEKSMTNAKVYLEELQMKKEIGIISEEEYKVKEPKFKWDIDNYQNEIFRRKKELELLEDPTNVMPFEKIEQMKKQVDKNLNEMNQLNAVYRINQETKNKVINSLEEMHNFFKSFNVWDQNQFNGKTHDLEILAKEELVIQEDILNKEFKSIVKKEEEQLELHERPDDILESSKLEIQNTKPQLIRVECPYDSKGKKCRTKAFGNSEVNALEKLKNHVKKDHPEKFDEFSKTILKK
jgi:hypothetical protein